jgi:hypothetical protein
MKEQEFTIKCKMNPRWIPHFLSMLKYMERLGNIGSSRRVSIFSDGDGDFRPKFEFSEDLNSKADPITNNNGDVTYDAG